MNGRYREMHSIDEQNRNTVGGAHTNSLARFIANESVARTSTVIEATRIPKGIGVNLA